MTARTPDEAPELPAPLGVSPVEAVEIVRKLADDIRRNGMAEEEDARELERTGRKVRGRFSASSARSRSRRLLRRADALDMVARAAEREAELMAALKAVIDRIPQYLEFDADPEVDDRERDEFFVAYRTAQRALARVSDTPPEAP